MKTRDSAYNDTRSVSPNADPSKRLLLGKTELLSDPSGGLVIKAAAYFDSMSRLDPKIMALSASQTLVDKHKPPVSIKGARDML